MFDSTRRFQTNSEYAREQANKRTITAAAVWAREAETWFDGSVDSVDRRLAVCKKLIAQHEAALADNIGDPRRIASVAQLEQAKTALMNLRADLLTGAEWRHETTVAPSAKQTQRLLATLSSGDRRYVDLESAKILRNNPGCSDPRELAGRAWRQASLDFSKFGTRRSDRVADAMAAQVYRLASRIKPKRTAAARPRRIEDFPAELLYL